LLQDVDGALAAGQRAARATAGSQTGLFDLGAPLPAANGPEAAVEEFSRAELLAMERDMLGLYISGHPLASVRDRLAPRVTATIAQLPEMRDRSDVVVGGLVTALKRTMTKSGSAMAFLTLEDLTGSVEVIVFPKTYEQNTLHLRRDAILVVRGKLDVAEQQAKVLADSVIPLDEIPAPSPAPRGEAAATPTLHVVVDAARHGEEGLRRLRDLLMQHQGDRPVLLTLRANGRDVRMHAGGLRVAGEARVIDAVDGLLGPHSASWISNGHD
jgi:DNA polymerase-3 subunit alpha